MGFILEKKLQEHFFWQYIFFVVNSVGVGRMLMERYGDNPDADHMILKVNGLGAADVSFKIVKIFSLLLL